MDRSLLILLLLLPLPATGWEMPSEQERMLVEKASRCKRAKQAPDPFLLLKVLRTEQRAGVPKRLRGMTLAAACHESGFDRSATGDREFSPKNRPLAKGFYQMWPWWEQAYGIVRGDPLRATEAWLAHIRKQVDKVPALCGRRGTRRTWIIAWVRAIRASPSRCLRRKLGKGRWGNIYLAAKKKLSLRQRRQCYRCYEEPKHLPVLRGFQK